VCATIANFGLKTLWHSHKQDIWMILPVNTNIRRYKLLLKWCHLVSKGEGHWDDKSILM